MLSAGAQCDVALPSGLLALLRSKWLLSAPFPTLSPPSALRGSEANPLGDFREEGGAAEAARL